MDKHTKQLIEKAAQILKIAGANEVFVFGSVTKGTLNDSSDIDLAVTGLPPRVFFRTMAQVEDILRRPVDLVDLDEQTPFTQYLKDEGELQRVG